MNLNEVFIYSPYTVTDLLQIFVTDFTFIHPKNGKRKRIGGHPGDEKEGSNQAWGGKARRKGSGGWMVVGVSEE